MSWIKVFALVGLLFGVVASYQVKPRNYDKLVQQQKKFDEQFEQEFLVEHLKYAQTGNKSARLEEMFEYLRHKPDMFRLELDEHPIPYQTTECTACRALVTTYLMYRRVLNWDRERIAAQAASTCESLEILLPENCVKIIDKNIDVLLYIIDNKPSLSAQTVCGVVFQSGSCVLEDPEFLDWTINISPGGTPITASKTGPSRSASDFKIIHVTDLHYDPHYRTGYNAVCGEPCCCREGQGIPANPADGAGEWGDYRDCDSPWKAVEDAVREAGRKHPDATYVYHTGDIIDHGVWETTIAGNIRSITRTSSLLKEVFPYKPVYNVLGNHEITPTNVYAPSHITAPEFSASWVYELVADLWGEWLPAEARQTITRGGFYTVLVRPGFRIIGLNNNDAYTFNWWILYDPAYLRGQLQWLHDTLLQAETAGEKVHILAHIPIGSGSTLVTWARQYRRILDRFWDTVTAHFHGHTHADEFNIFYSAASPQFAINVAFNGGGTVPFSNYNPNYIVYYVNSQTFEVTDYESFYFNLTEANLHPLRDPLWQDLYSFSRDFSIPNVSPATLDGLARRFGSTPTDLHRYWEFKVKRGDPFLERGCDGSCLINQLCGIVRNEANDDRKCDEMIAIYRKGEDDRWNEE
ncbi:sphingomyelin phosphodiesterase-like [Topomyia yanbarensis]|uniref:sphingomyelin phosphodiesterase-like n=1 Tax=Topomyia yanbarensis TaxID=2498891 RepID=UPI00273AA40E|nr:sphingomyelin phosphodiesterase-like [Topomyia yanbarensis]